MKRLAITTLLLAAFIFPALADTRVFLMTGWGPQAWSPGIFQIAAQAKQIPGVTFVGVYQWFQTQDIANAIMAAPKTARIVVGGYSCGANSPTSIAYGLNGHRHIDTVVGIQESLWCGGYPLYGNVSYGQETYGGCLMTLGFGCKKYAAGQGFTGKITLIQRPDLHPLADVDLDAQADVLRAIAATTKLQGPLRHRPQVQEIVRFHGQHP